MSDLTVFVVGDDARGSALQETVARWADEGLVVPSVWVTPSGVHVGTAGPPRVDAELVAQRSRAEDDLFRIVGRRHLSTVRIVVAQVLTLDGPFDPALLTAAQHVADALQDALPQATEEGGHSTALLRINLLAPVSGASGVPREAIADGWDVNVVVSAEDRPDVDRSNVFVRSPGNAVGHAATAMVVCGGALAGVDAGVFEVLAPPQSTANGREVEVVRVHVRAVVGEDLESRLAARTLQAVAAEPQGAAAFVEWARLAVDPDRIVDDLTKHLVQAAPWGSAGPPRVDRADRRRSGVLEGVAEAARFNATTFGAVPRWVVGKRIARFEDSATHTVVGGGGDTVLRLRPGRPDAIKGAVADYLQDVDERARRDELEREATSVAVPDPRSWGELRTVAFAAVDGGDLPADVPTPRYAGKREILTADRVVPDPTDTFDVDGDTITPTDPTVGRRVEARLDAVVAQWGTALDEAEREVARTRQALEATQAPPDPDKSTDPGTEASDDAATDTPDAPTEPDAAPNGGKSRPAKKRGRKPEPDVVAEIAARGAALAAARSEHEAAERARDGIVLAHDAARCERDRFLGWRGTAESSVLWRLLDDVAGRRDQYAEQHARAREGLGVDVPPHEALVAAQERLVARWRVLLLAGLVVLAVAVLWLRFDGQPERVLDWVGWVGGTVLVTLLLVGVANHRYYQATRAYAWDVQTVADRRRQASEDVVYYGREAARLGQLYSTLVDWATVVGWVLHHPRGTVVPTVSTLDDDAVDTFPAAFAVARTADEDDITPATVVTAVQRLHPVGWARQCFDDAYDAHQAAQAREDEGGFIAPDLDTVASQYGPRSLFTEFWTSGAAAEVLTAKAVAELREAVHEELISLPTRQVGRLGSHGDGDLALEPDYYRAAAGRSTAFVAGNFVSSARQTRKHYVERSAVWLPQVVGGQVAPEGVVQRRSTTDVAVRVDVSRRLDAGDLLLFAPDTDTSDEVADEAPVEPVTVASRPVTADAPIFH
ncbi:hypothetical protein ATJ88_3527 [Isoptericola jiangsuensis]|uniref:Uncharacterized protein n=1 Tax=Isoptericola jiangsuensis TaxID=548579 RepID=A0A2A9F2Q3_9MICO|nr:hypothetical protein [Isoptericola jiangsuensis]PFG44790.1 hypothetical protein ATJ88_3527 [Isoptericola jiangsuensis]